MLHLAQVKKNVISGELELKLLAYQKSEHLWAISNPESLPLHIKDVFNEGLLVLVELSEKGEIIRIQEAKDWILELIEMFLTNGAITPDFIAKEQAKVEQWRQELASQSQDLTRKHLEIETRREQLQELEESLNQEKEKLESKIKNEEIN
jgi:hypothetical protein